MATERTPLRTGPSGGPGMSDQGTTYVFMTNSGRLHRNKIRQFQCCVCAAILGVFVMALVITISYSVESVIEDNNVTTPAPSENATIKTLLRSSWPIPDADAPEWPATDTSPEAVQAAIASGRQELAARALLEARTPPMQEGTPSYRANQAVKTRPEAVTLAMRGTVEERATHHLLKASGRDPSSRSPVGRGPRLLDVDPACAEEQLPIPCPATPYRSPDGSCNNLQHPRSWGVAMRPFRRVLPAAYEDGVSSPRTTGLPSAREVSVTIHRPLYRDDPDFTVMLAVWGQFLDHDITATALSQRSNGSAISCCGASEQHPECFTVPLAAGDPYYHKYNVTCMEFVRSAPAATCSLGPREQLNQATSFLDGSVVYGSTVSIMSSLRESQSGRLKMSATPDGRELLPVSDDPHDGCNREEMNKRGRYCFMSGDARANENLHLTTLHLLWARQHNRVSSRLHAINPHWSDEKVFQEARKLVAAQIQHITYNEFLPVILGPQLMANLELTPKKTGYYSGYDPEVDPTICNSFAASSFRFAHTLLPGLLKLIGNDTSSPEFIELHQMLFDPYKLYSRDGADRALRGAMETGIERADNYFNPELTQRLFAQDAPKRSIGHGSAGHPACGLDLVSLNVQRGRDHGLPPYPAWREHCGYQRPTSWDDLKGIVDAESLSNMKTIYKSVDDVDVYTGSLSEHPVEGGLLGETVTCMLTDQFVRLKRGDRFWYETDEKPQAFTPAQLAEIRKTSLAGVICETSDGVHAAQPQVMRRAHAANERVPCSNLPHTNLRAWVERKGHFVVTDAGILRATDKPAPPQHQDDVPDDQVLVTEGSNPGKEDDVPSKARAVRVGGHVTGGSVVTSTGSTLWSGSVPFSVPIPDKNSGEFFSEGVRWEGRLVSSGGVASLEGTFSVTSFSRAAEGISPSHVTRGRVSVQFVVDWETSEDGVFDVSGSFRSPVYLRAVHPSVGKDVLVETKLVRDAQGSDLVAPFVLDGYYTDAGTFFWNGNFTFVLPTSSVFSSDNDAVLDSSPEVMSYSLESSSAIGPAAHVSAEVVGGKVTARLAGQPDVTWWNGTLPLELPTSLFNINDKSQSKKQKVPMNKQALSVDGVMWSARLEPSSTASSTFLTGTFKLPKFVHGKSPAIEWWSGSFSVEMRLIGQDSLQGLVGDELMTSRLIFQSDGSSLQAPANIDSVLSLVAAAQGIVEEAASVPVVFKGAYSADHSTFSWGGKIVMIFPAAKQEPEAPALQLLTGKPKPAKAKPSSPQSNKDMMKIAAKVTSGSIVSSEAGQVWSGALPAAISTDLFDASAPHPHVNASSGMQYVYGVVWNGTLTASASSLVLEGTYSLPRRTSGDSPFLLEWLTGTFSFTMEPLWASDPYSGAVQPGETFISPIYFHSAMESAPSVDSNNAILFREKSLGAFAADSAGNLLGAQRAPVILQGATSPDGSAFNWNGNVIIALPRPPAPAPSTPSTPHIPALQASAAPSTLYQKIGVRVTSGSVYAYPEGAWFWRTWWSGSLPSSIPVPIFDSRGTTVSSYPKGPVFHACGIAWTGSITALTPRSVRIKGKFSFPHYDHSATGLSVTWYYGTFDFSADLLWDASINDIELPEGDLYTHLYFRPQKLTKADRVPVSPAQLSMLQFAMDSQELVDGAKLNVPVVIDGSFSEDHASFVWTGDAVLSIPRTRVPNPAGLLTKSAAVGKKPSLKAKVQKGDSSKAAKAAKAAKAQITGTVIGGYVDATYDNSSSSRIWSGVAPMWLPNPLFGVASFTLPQTITWSGSVDVNTTTKIAEVSGTFSMPFYEPGSMTPHVWKGEFLIQVQMVYPPKSDIGQLRKKTTYSSRVVYVPPKLATGDSKPVPAIVFASEDEVPSTTILLQGTYSFWSSKWFWWTGVASIYLPLSSNNDTVLTQSASRLSASSGKTPQSHAKNLAIAVVEGSISAQRDGQAPGGTAWSGALPAAIPTSQFEDGGSPEEHVKLVLWTAQSVRAAPGGVVELKGSFSFPKSLRSNQSGSDFPLEWWSGEFSLDVRQIGNDSIINLVQENKKYLSPIIFKQMMSNESVTDLLQVVTPFSGKQRFLSAAAGFGESAERLAIVLQGSYSPDRSIFSWTGNALLQTSKTPKKPDFAGGKKKKKLLMRTSSAQKTEERFPKIGALAVTGSVSVQKQGGDTETLWSGSFPVPLPSSASGQKRGVFWTGSLTRSSANTAVLSGNYSAPLSDANGDVVWWKGSFSVTLQLLWNTTLDAVLPKDTYFSSVYYRPRGFAEDADYGDWKNDVEQLAAVAEEALQGAPRVLVLLDGYYPQDNASFLWPGKVILVPIGKPEEPLLLKAAGAGAALVSEKRASLGVKVSSGSLTPSLWGGALPASVPVAAIRQIRPFTWRASQISIDSTGVVSVKGTYSAALRQAGTWDAPTWQEGDFSFSGNLLWNNAPSPSLIQGSNFTSAIYLQHAGSSERSLAPSYVDPRLWPTERLVASDGKAPVILQGYFSEDGQTFEWLGNTVVAIPVA